MDATPILLENQLAAFRQAVQLAGGQEKFAAIAGRTQPSVSRRLRAQLALWADAVLKVEAATGVSRHELRPDLYPLEPAAPTDGHQPTLADTRPAASVSGAGASVVHAPHPSDPDALRTCDRGATSQSVGEPVR